MGADGGYRERLAQRLVLIIEQHRPGDVDLICPACLAEGDLVDWPCDEARYATTVDLMLQRLIPSRPTPPA